MIYILFRFYLVVEGMRRVGEGGKDQNRPKWRQTCHFGHWYVFFFSSCFFCQLTNNFLLSTGPSYVLKTQRGFEWVSTAKMGPGTSFWAQICNFFFSFSCFFCTLIDFFAIYRFYLCLYSKRRIQMPSDNQNGPKWHQAHRLGLRCIFLFYFMFLHILTGDFYYL